MSNPSSHSPDPSRHRRYKPGKAVSSPSESASEHLSSSAESLDTPGSPDLRVTLSALEQNYGARLADIEERLAAAEREVFNLGGQIKEMR